MVLIKDPDAMISSETAQLAEIIGEGLSFTHAASIFVAIIIGIANQVYRLISCIKFDFKKGSCRRTIKGVAKFMITMLAIDGGSYIGCQIGCMTGIQNSSTFGAVIGGLLAVIGTDLALSSILKTPKRDVVLVKCKKCGQKFECRICEKILQKKRERCRNKKTD